MSEVATTEAVRAPPRIRASSPKKSPGRARRPAGSACRRWPGRARSRRTRRRRRPRERGACRREPRSSRPPGEAGATRAAAASGTCGRARCRCRGPRARSTAAITSTPPSICSGASRSEKTAKPSTGVNPGCTAETMLARAGPSRPMPPTKVNMPAVATAPTAPIRANAGAPTSSETLSCATPATVSVAAAPVVTSAVSRNGSVRFELTGRGEDVGGVGDGGAEREACAERVDAADAADQHERGARRRRRERDRPATAPAVAPQQHRAQHDQRRVGEQQHVDETGVEPRQRRREQPRVGAEPDAEQQPGQDLPPIGALGPQNQDERPQDRAGGQEPARKQGADRGAGVEGQLRRDAQPREEDHGRERQADPDDRRTAAAWMWIRTWRHGTAGVAPAVIGSPA